MNERLIQPNLVTSRAMRRLMDGPTFRDFDLDRGRFEAVGTLAINPKIEPPNLHHIHTRLSPTETAGMLCVITGKRLVFE